MLKTIFILGRQPNLGLAELERSSRVGDILSFGDNASSGEETDPAAIDYLGGTRKIVKVSSQTTLQDWDQIEKFIVKQFLDQIVDLPEGKINLGISCYGWRVNPNQINRTSLFLKKLVKAKGRSIRVVPNNDQELSTAQVEHNKLTGNTGIEIVLVASNMEVTAGVTVASQNIEAYAARDQARPKRDARVGMLPPKLAQIMLNIANPTKESWVLDPFCGTGVVLQEALLAGHKSFGTDLDPRMVDYSQENLEWLNKTFGKTPEWKVEQGDATDHKWNLDDFSVVSEIYLGKPLFEQPSDNQLNHLVAEVNQLTKEFLVNLSHQLKSESSICLAVPAWRINQGFKTLPILDHLEEIGYNHLSFKTVNTRELIYNRPQQLVARQLLSLSRK